MIDAKSLLGRALKGTRRENRVTLFYGKPEVKIIEGHLLIELEVNDLIQERVRQVFADTDGKPCVRLKLIGDRDSTEMELNNWTMEGQR